MSVVAERFVQSAKDECLDHFLFFGEKDLWHGRGPCSPAVFRMTSFLIRTVLPDTIDTRPVPVRLTRTIGRDKLSRVSAPQTR
jgi:hypothetical protein